MSDLILTTFDWVPETPRGYVRDIRVRWALEEAGLPYRVESTPFRDRKAEHFAHQPFGQAPWLTDGDISIFESGAILLHLGERSDALMPADPRGRSDAKEWLFAALNSVEAASLPWSILVFSGESHDTRGLEAFGRVPQGSPAPAHGAGIGGTRMARRDLLRRRHPHGGCAAPRRSVRRAGELSRLSRLCRARHGPTGLREGIRRPDGAFCCGRCSLIHAPHLLSLRHEPNRPLGSAGRHRRIGAQRRSRLCACASPRASRRWRRVPAIAWRRRASSASSTASLMVRFGMSISIKSPSSTSAMAPPSAASGETWQIDRPDVPPEKRPSVISAQALPRPFDFR